MYQSIYSKSHVCILLVTKSPDSESLVTTYKKKRIPSASAALVIGSVMGLLQAILLIFGAKPVLGFMGIKSVSTGIDVYFLNNMDLYVFYNLLLHT